MEKLYYSMSEVSKIIDEPASTIRFWNTQFSSYLNPYRTAKGNRMFKEDELELLKEIKFLLSNENLTIKGALARLAAERGKVKAKTQILESLKLIRSKLTEAKKKL